jgi:hypothetical protein
MEEHRRIRSIGRIGFWVALAPWFAVILTFVCAAVDMPGFG